LKRVKAEFGTAGIGALAHPGSTVEELHLLSKLTRALGSESVDYRLRHADFAHTAPAGRARWLGLPVASLSQLDRALVIGSFLRKDHPLFAQRLRQAARRGAQVHSLHATQDDWLMPMAGHLLAAPGDWVQTLADVAAAVAAAAGVEAPVPGTVTVHGQRIAASLMGGERKAVLLGNAAAQHPQAGALLALAQWIAAHCGATCGYTVDGGNAVGAQLVGAVPGPGGLNAGQMLSQPMKALLLLNVEPQFDAADAAVARKALAGAGLVVALTAFKDAAADVADVMLPLTPFTETAGTFVNAEGRVQGFHGVVKPLGDARPGWKVLRVLGNLLGLPGFDFETAESVRAEALGDESTLAARLDNTTAQPVTVTASARPAGSLERLADVPIYATDMMVRRSHALQDTRDGQPPVVGLPSALWQRLHLSGEAKVLVMQGEGAVVLPAREEAGLADGVVRIAAGHAATAALGAMFGPVTVEKA
jgi:NADH-quinone oxidoreductase subunit G